MVSFKSVPSPKQFPISHTAENNFHLDLSNNGVIMAGLSPILCCLYSPLPLAPQPGPD